LDDSQAGLFSTVQFLVALCGTLASSAITTRWGYRFPLLAGYALMAAGVFSLNAHSHAAALGATGAYGFGYGLITPVTNLFVAELGGAKSAPLLSLLNFSWGVGAMTCSPLIAWALKNNSLPFVLIGFAICGAALVLSLSFTSFGLERHERNANAAEAKEASGATGALILLAALFFIYVAMENGVGIWSAEYSRRIAGAITGLTTLTPMFFYAGLTAGRAGASLFLRRLSENKVVFGSLVLAAGGILLLIFSPSVRIVLAAVFLTGVGCASVYPIYIAWLSRWYGARARKIGGVLFAIASLGGSCGAWAIGMVSQLSESLRAGYVVPLVGTLAMIGLVFMLRRLSPG
jgi:fucose permease